jgi:hypothetical protein
VHKGERTARAEDIGPGELGCQCGGCFRIQSGERSCKLRVGLLV